MENRQSPGQHKRLFIGDVSDPFCSPKITEGLVEFYVRPTQVGELVPEEEAELIDQDGLAHTVTICAIGHIVPDRAANKWRPGDFLIRVEGITMSQAIHMRQLRQTQGIE